MPIYDYSCSLCDAREAVLRKVSQRDDDLCCPMGHSMKRGISQGTGFALKGEGWYRDHYGLKPGGSKETN